LINIGNPFSIDKGFRKEIESTGTALKVPCVTVFEVGAISLNHNLSKFFSQGIDLGSLNGKGLRFVHGHGTFYKHLILTVSLDLITSLGIGWVVEQDGNSRQNPPYQNSPRTEAVRKRNSDEIQIILGLYF
jgi:hypothetical protein